ncbi:MAG: divalent metal cation transporter, partial [bacterium]
LQVFVSYRNYAKYLKWLSLSLLAYVLSLLIVKVDWSQLAFHTVVPSLEFSKEQIILICGILGTTISPYLFFWQTSQEVEEEIEQGRTTIKERQATTTKQEMKRMRVDVWVGMFYSNFVMFAIIATCAATLYAAGVTNIESATDAAAALKPLAGHFAYLLFTIGIIGIGLSSVPVLAGSAGYGIAESLRWNEGLSKKWSQAKLFYGTIIVSMLIGLGLNFVNIDPIKALIYAAVLNGIVAPFMIVYIVRISASKKIMNHWANGRFTNAIGWITAVAMFIVGAAAIWALLP